MTASPLPNRGFSILRSWKNLDVRQLRHHWLSVASSIISCGLAIYGIWSPDRLQQDVIWRLLVSFALGISLFLVTTLVFDRDKDRRRHRFAVAAAACALAIYVFISREWTNVFFFYKTAQAYVLCHLLVSLTPYFRNRNLQEKEFWSSNWFLLNRFHMAGTQSVLLLVGISLALVSIKNLFGIEVRTEIFGTIASILVFFVSVMLFIGSLGDRKEVVEPAEILKRLVRTVLTPLAIAYFLILYAYGLKVLIQREWPRGSIGLMASGLAMIITLSYVIMRPLATSEEFGPKLKRFWSWSFRLLLGPVVLVMLGLARRVSEYGWTEQRAALGYLALWMFGIGIYYWHPNRRSLVAIPLSLSVVLLLTWFGPLSPSFLGEKSQASRLNFLLEKNRATLTFADKKNINSILQTVCESYGVHAMTKAANVQVEARKTSKDEIAYGSIDYARLCDDDQSVQPAAPGPVSQALLQLQIPKIDRYATTDTTLDFTFERFGKENLIFSHMEIGSFSFEDWHRGGAVGSADFEEQQHGSLKVRFRQQPATIEWEAARGVWRRLDLGLVTGFMRDAGPSQRTSEEYGKGLRIVDEHLGRRLELQITSARFVESNFDRLGSIQFTTLVERSRPSK